MAVKKKPFTGLLPGDTKVEMVSVHKKTHKAWVKIIELSEFPLVPRKSNFHYYVFQIGYSKYKDAIKL